MTGFCVWALPDCCDVPFSAMLNSLLPLLYVHGQSEVPVMVLHALRPPRLGAIRGTLILGLLLAPPRTQPSSNQGTPTNPI